MTPKQFLTEPNAVYLVPDSRKEHCGGHATHIKTCAECLAWDASRRRVNALNEQAFLAGMLGGVSMTTKQQSLAEAFEAWHKGEHPSFDALVARVRELEEIARLNAGTTGSIKASLETWRAKCRELEAERDDIRKLHADNLTVLDMALADRIPFAEAYAAPIARERDEWQRVAAEAQEQTAQALLGEREARRKALLEILGYLGAGAGSCALEGIICTLLEAEPKT